VRPCDVVVDAQASIVSCASETRGPRSRSPRRVSASSRTHVRQRARVRPANARPVGAHDRTSRLIHSAGERFKTLRRECLTAPATETKSERDSWVRQLRDAQSDSKPGGTYNITPAAPAAVANRTPRSFPEAFRKTIRRIALSPTIDLQPVSSYPAPPYRVPKPWHVLRQTHFLQPPTPNGLSTLVRVPKIGTRSAPVQTGG